MRPVCPSLLIAGFLGLLTLLPAAVASESDRRAEVFDAKPEGRNEGNAGKADAKPDSKGEKAESKAEVRSDSKPAARAEGGTDPRNEARTEPRRKSVAAPARQVPAASAAQARAVPTALPGGGAASPAESRPPLPPVMPPAPRTEPIAPVAQAFPLAGGEHGADPRYWTYEGDHGPAAWAELAPEFAACANGSRQSPIDIREGIRVDLEPIHFDYRESSFKVIDNGHTVQVNVAPGNAIKVMGRRFNLVEFHFHRPSEELIDGHAAEMVVHLTHKDADGKFAVLAVLLESGKAQAEVQSVWNNLPLEKNEEMAASSRMDLMHLLPEDRRYYTYMGSLTTPPCTEGVLWLVMKQAVTLSPAQIALFARLYPMNARPMQSAAGRMIKESN